MSVIPAKVLEDKQSTATGLPGSVESGSSTDYEMYQRRGYLKYLAPSAALFVMLIPNSGAPRTNEYEPGIAETTSAETSGPKDFQEMSERYEEIIFTHPATISDIQYGPDDRAKTVTLLVSIDGKEMVLNTPVQNFDFEIAPNMRIMVEGALRGREKCLKFRKVEPLKLDEEQKDILSKVVSSFKSI
jgi:hypothetical protein